MINGRARGCEGIRPPSFDTLHVTVPIAILTFDFDPLVQVLGDLTVRWGAVALTTVIIAALVLAGVLAKGGGLRADDVPFIAVGIVPGAVIGGRIGYFILHSEFLGSPSVLVDPSVGGMELGCAVVGGFLTGSYVASLLGASVGRWLHAAAAAVLFAIGAGKLTMVLTGAGQGLPSLDAWATAYLGPGPWGSLAPALPSVPSQALEGIATLAILTALTIVLMDGGFRRHDGRLFFVGIGLWALARAAVSTTWRDPEVVGGLNAGGLIALAIALGCGVAIVILTIRRGEDPETTPPPTPMEPGLAWPDPETRPPF
jgi:prolipoprotein diacylglyceryltransferase